MTDQPGNGPDSDRLSTRIRAGRSELEGTLDAIEDKLNVPKQVGKLTAKSRDSFEQNPVPWYVGAVAVVVALGGAIVLSVSRRN